MVPQAAKGAPEYKDWLAWMKKYNTSADISDLLAVLCYSAAQTLVSVLKACGDNLTRGNVMRQAANIHDLTQPMHSPGIVVSTSPTDFAPIKQMQIVLTLNNCHFSSVLFKKMLASVVDGNAGTIEQLPMPSGSCRCLLPSTRFRSSSRDADQGQNSWQTTCRR
jgi:hypothetical protein